MNKSPLGNKGVCWRWDLESIPMHSQVRKERLIISAPKKAVARKLELHRETVITIVLLCSRRKKKKKRIWFGAIKRFWNLSSISFPLPGSAEIPTHPTCTWLFWYCSYHCTFPTSTGTAPAAIITTVSVHLTTSSASEAVVVVAAVTKVMGGAAAAKNTPFFFPWKFSLKMWRCL